jgi:hypothetical protein
LQHIDDKALYDLIEKASLAEKLENDPAWKMLKEAGERIVDRAITEFALKCKPNDIEHIILLQTVIKKYKYGLFDEVRVLKTEADQAFLEAQERGVIGDFFASVKAKIGI